jgi:hypothetical protein
VQCEQFVSHGLGGLKGHVVYDAFYSVRYARVVPVATVVPCCANGNASANGMYHQQCWKRGERVNVFRIEASQVQHHLRSQSSRAFTTVHMHMHMVDIHTITCLPVDSVTGRCKASYCQTVVHL